MLEWPLEVPDSLSSCAQWQQGASNIVLDFHGDPFNAGLCIVSDGNHHMALAESIEQLVKSLPEMNGVFYVTLPPPAIKRILEHQCVMLGNLKIPVHPDLMLSPYNVMQGYSRQGICTELEPFVTHRGCALLVAKNNPKSISSIKDLLRDDVTLFLSNPDTEAVSYAYYRHYLLDKSLEVNLQAAMESKLNQSQGMQYGQCIHHREAPQSLAEGKCDVVLLYYHLALRFSRVFAEQFDMLPLIVGGDSGVKNNPNDHIYIGLINHPALSGKLNKKRVSSQWTVQARDFMLSDEVASIYRKHGLDTLCAKR